MPARAIVAVVNPKGGSGKSTAAAHIAEACAEQGARVLAFDADSPQFTLWKWSTFKHPTDPSRDVAFGFRVERMATPRLHRDVPTIEGADVIVIDTPGHGERGVTISAIKAATHLLVVVGANGAEMAELDRVRELIEEATMRGAEPVTAVMLVKVDGRQASSNQGFRERVVEEGWNLLGAEAGQLVRFQHAYEAPIENAAATAYGAAITELLKMEATRGKHSGQ